MRAMLGYDLTEGVLETKFNLLLHWDDFRKMKQKDALMFESNIRTNRILRITKNIDLKI